MGARSLPEPEFVTSAYRLHGADIVRVEFGRAVKRGGLDPYRVRAFLDRVAAEVAARDRDLRQLVEENQRLKDALTRWQSGHAPRHRVDGYLGAPPTPPAPAAAWAAPTTEFQPVQPDGAAGGRWPG